ERDLEAELEALAAVGGVKAKHSTITLVAGEHVLGATHVASHHHARAAAGEASFQARQPWLPPSFVAGAGKGNQRTSAQHAERRHPRNPYQPDAVDSRIVTGAQGSTTAKVLISASHLVKRKHVAPVPVRWNACVLFSSGRALSLPLSGSSPGGSCLHPPRRRRASPVRTRFRSSTRTTAKAKAPLTGCSRTTTRASPATPRRPASTSARACRSKSPATRRRRAAPKSTSTSTGWATTEAKVDGSSTAPRTWRWATTSNATRR